jgi:hypothetical protein
LPLLPPQPERYAQFFLSLEKYICQLVSHQREMLSTANPLMSWLVPTLAKPTLLLTRMWFSGSRHFLIDLFAVTHRAKYFAYGDMPRKDAALPQLRPYFS